ncbi:hypothetical protein HDV57DRAFT_106237 [Trichoderma longibrachiatum]|uniref:Uncharacterized protein n=1 Tax=Trichoderma longibrachiatum ATCC 18648 TaxID=983965 RepID=A0A2T4C932_TRILO|nr:hypothetical protein M440DRAFT_252491 [Trichoderma longibrachiatum ATCC 18648]
MKKDRDEAKEFTISYSECASTPLLFDGQSPSYSTLRTLYLLSPLQPHALTRTLYLGRLHGFYPSSPPKLCPPPTSKPTSTPPLPKRTSAQPPALQLIRATTPNLSAAHFPPLTSYTGSPGTEAQLRGKNPG